MFTVVVGAWLLAAPTVLGYTAADRGSAGFWSTVAAAAAALVLAVIRAAAGTAPVVRSGGILLGGWLVVAPAVLGTGSRDGVVAGEVVAGLLLVALAAAGLRAMVVARRVG